MSTGYEEKIMGKKIIMACPICGFERPVLVYNLKKYEGANPMCAKCARRKAGEKTGEVFWHGRAWDHDPWATGQLPESVTRNQLYG